MPSAARSAGLTRTASLPATPCACASRQGSRLARPCGQGAWSDAEGRQAGEEEEGDGSGEEAPAVQPAVRQRRGRRRKEEGSQHAAARQDGLRSACPLPVLRGSDRSTPRGDQPLRRGATPPCQGRARSPSPPGPCSHARRVRAAFARLPACSPRTLSAPVAHGSVRLLRGRACIIWVRACGRGACSTRRRAARRRPRRRDVVRRLATRRSCRRGARALGMHAARWRPPFSQPGPRSAVRCADRGVVTRRCPLAGPTAFARSFACGHGERGRSLFNLPRRGIYSLEVR